jgi:hypothetical protein
LIYKDFAPSGAKDHTSLSKNWDSPPAAPQYCISGSREDRVFSFHARQFDGQANPVALGGKVHNGRDPRQLRQRSRSEPLGLDREHDWVMAMNLPESKGTYVLIAFVAQISGFLGARSCPSFSAAWTQAALPAF